MGISGLDLVGAFVVTDMNLFFLPGREEDSPSFWYDVFEAALLVLLSFFISCKTAPKSLLMGLLIWLPRVSSLTSQTRPLFVSTERQNVIGESNQSSDS